MNTPTPDVVAMMLPKNLIATFNRFAPFAGMKPVTRFKTHTVGVNRLNGLIELIVAGGLVPTVGVANPVVPIEISAVPTMIGPPTPPAPDIVNPSGVDATTAVPDASDTFFGPLLHPKTMHEIMNDLRAAGEIPAVVKRQRYGKPAKMDTIVTIVDKRFASGKHGLPTRKDALKATAKIAAKIMKAPTEKKPSRASRIREMVTAGMTNKEIWPIIQKKFGMRDDQRSVVGFHRWKMRQG